jgi:hypothetical protein
VRIAGWVLLIAGFLLCVSIFWATIGFLFMGLGLICLQIAEQRNKRLAKLAALQTEAINSRREPPQLQAASRDILRSDQGTHFSGESTIDRRSNDRERWRVLLSTDSDLARLAEVLAPFGQKYVDELAAAYLVFNDKKYLPTIVQKIITSARMDSGHDASSEPISTHSNTDALGETLGMTRPAPILQRVHDDDPVPVNNVAETVQAGLNKAGVSELLQSKLEGRETAIEKNSSNRPTMYAAVGRDLNRGTQDELKLQMNLVPPATTNLAEDDKEMSLKGPAAIADARSDLNEERRNVMDAINPSPTVPASDESVIQTTATDEIKANLEKTVVSDFDAMVQAALKEMSAKTLEASAATGGGNEKKKNLELDADDVDSLTDIFEQINQVLDNK